MDTSRDWIIIKETADRLRVQTFRRLFARGDGRTVLDLGCGPGNFSRHARDAGWKVTAVDGRSTMLPDLFSLDGTRKFYVLNPRSTDSAFPLDGSTLAQRGRLLR